MTLALWIWLKDLSTYSQNINSGHQALVLQYVLDSNQSWELYDLLVELFYNIMTTSNTIKYDSKTHFLLLESTQ